MDEFADHFAAIFCSELENEGRSLVMSNGPGRLGISGTARSALRVPVSDPALVIGLAAPGSTYGSKFRCVPGTAREELPVRARDHKPSRATSWPACLCDLP